MSTETRSPLVAGWVRIALVALGVPNLLTGAWAVVSPQAWFDRFPGWDPRLVAAEPPYNAHLATDAGAGLLASGVIALGAAWLGDRRSVRLGLVGYGCFAIPHALWHAFNPSDALTGAEDLQNAGLLVFSALATVGLLIVTGRSGPVDPAHERAPEEVAT